jgi:hypothetical protein
MILSNWTRAKKPSFAYLQAAVNGGENNASTTDAVGQCRHEETEPWLVD